MLVRAFTSLLTTVAIAAGPVATIPTGSGNHPTAVAVQGSHAYVVNYCGTYCYGPLDVIDIDDPAAPALVGSTPDSWGADAIALQGTDAYTSGYYANPNYMRIVDVANPAAPTSLAAFTTEGAAPQGLAVRGRFVYMVDNRADRLDVIDVSDPDASWFSITENTSGDSLPLVARIRTAAGPSRIALQGSYAYVVNTVADDVQIVSVADPARPVVVGTSPRLGPRGRRGLAGSDIAVSGDWAYVANDDTGRLDVLDVSDPAHPTAAASVAAGGGPDGIALSGQDAYVVSRASNALEEYDIATPARPSLVASQPTGAEPDGVAVAGAYAYVASYGADRLQVFAR